MTEETKDTSAQAEQGAQLSLSDLAAMKSIIDTASARGAFKPNEMMVVGQTYNKLTTFLESIKAQSQGETK